MKKNCVIILVLGISLLPFSPVWGAKAKASVPRPEQREAREIFDNEVQQKRHDFLETLKGKSAQEKREAMNAFREKEEKEKKEFLAKQHAGNMDFLKKKMTDLKLSEAEKEELVTFFEKQYAESVSFQDYAHKEAIADFDKMISDPSLTQEQRKNVIRKISTDEKERVRQYRAALKRQNAPTPAKKYPQGTGAGDRSQEGLSPMEK
jgi:hypothetical protein